MKNKIDIYLEKFSKEEQVQIEELRHLVKQLYDVEEGFSYGMPSFLWKGKVLCCFAMYKNHLGYYPYSGQVTVQLQSELKKYKTSVGAVQLPKNKPLPKSLIKKLLDTRAQEILDSNIYSYTAPKGIGFLHVTLDKDDRVTTSVFADKKTNLKLPSVISLALDDYFKNKKPLPKYVISRKITGTDFQKKVWNEIAKIPFGKSMSYKELALKVGDGNAVRAVGTTCGKNQCALFIPCHRVQSSDGKNTGYAWGKERKDWLLGFESKK